MNQQSDDQRVLVKTGSTSTAKKKFKMGGVRYLFSVIGFAGFAVLYAIRVNINVAIVAMVNGSAIYDSHNKSSSDECTAVPIPLQSNGSAYEPQKEGEFIWDPKLQSIVIGAFYYGYCVSQIPGGRMAEVFSGKLVFGSGIAISALLTLLTPIAADYHVGLLVAIRAFEGLAQGVTLPAIYTMIGKWIPETEKSFLTTFIYTGVNIGTVITMPITGILCNSDWFGGWPSAFYVVGISGFVWLILWCLLVTETPQSHPLITAEELVYISSNQKIEHNAKLPDIPWKKILTSAPVWVLILTQIGQDWSFYTVLNDLPTYFATILHLEIEKNGLLASIPHLLQTIVGLTTGFIVDLILRKRLVTTTFVRKFCTGMSGYWMAIVLTVVCFAGCNATLTITCFMLSTAVGGICYSGYNMVHLDLSPEYAGTLMGLANTFSNLAGFLAPLVVGALTEEQQTLQQWRWVFIITIIILVASTSIFVMFSSSEKQDWIQQEGREKILNSEKHEHVTKEGYRTIS